MPTDQVTPVVLVHGNPETAAVWDLLVEQLVGQGHDKPLCLSPPGFGAPVPTGWGATIGEYRDWLVAELERVGRPVHLVGHDWGGGHVVNVAMTRPDLLRSWCSDVIGLFDPDYVWHELAQGWQSLDDGEAAVARLVQPPVAEKVSFLVQRGMDASIAERIAPAMDHVMGECILRLYRSAAQPVMAELGAGLEAAAARPGLAIMASEDHVVGTEEQRRRSAARAGARAEVLDGLGHWWMTRDPERGAAVLTRFWASL
ncbi:alpha/beta fold hydrolase [Pseudonocardia yunnanensis]|uniref:Alpha/beta fold hydrolase n=1 Tax=Pseudonocardia yunnanensis TaxID=58107 RepID=A0ABW4ERI4_9PSEU